LIVEIKKFAFLRQVAPISHQFADHSAKRW